MHFDPQTYGPVFSRLTDTNRNRPLDPGRPQREARGDLAGVTIESAFAKAEVVDRGTASCCLAGVWLLYDFLDESHEISQGVHSASGSFWHGIMHRREGDFSNAKYWFRRVGEHPIFPDLQAAACALASRDATGGVPALAKESDWDPFAFVGACQAAVGGRSADKPLLRKIQQAEWELLFDHCYRQSVAP